jgi:hypothetical protein
MAELTDAGVTPVVKRLVREKSIRLEPFSPKGGRKYHRPPIPAAPSPEVLVWQDHCLPAQLLGNAWVSAPSLQP